MKALIAVLAILAGVAVVAAGNRREREEKRLGTREKRGCILPIAW